jgi:hypothetical protein
LQKCWNIVKFAIYARLKRHQLAHLFGHSLAQQETNKILENV